MNDKKICIIFCTNNKQYESECQKFINKLKVPDGYELEQLSVWDAASMASGYNEGMKGSDAKYKIYIHHDVFLVYPNLLSEILHIFENEKVGMIGLIGSPKLPENCIMWTEKRIGQIYASNVIDTQRIIFGEALYPYEEVEAVDGLFIATQYDLPWREDLFKGWDFYDISQSTEFRNNGYKIVVPATDRPWCIHDDGLMALGTYYDARDIYVSNYQKK